jgi:hypothetical protein
MIVLNENLQKSIDVRDMKDGEIAIIVSVNYKDVIVQRFGNRLISLGISCNNSWESILTVDRCLQTVIYVRVLQIGETLTIK